MRNPLDLTAEKLPIRCLDCDGGEEIYGNVYICNRMERTRILLPREVHRQRSVFCPIDPDYRPAVDIKKPRW